MPMLVTLTHASLQTRTMAVAISPTARTFWFLTSHTLPDIETLTLPKFPVAHPMLVAAIHTATGLTKVSLEPGIARTHAIVAHAHVVAVLVALFLGTVGACVA